MKAIKITHINWDLSSVPENKKAEVSAKLPKTSGFRVKDDFDVLNSVPRIYEKKYGYPVENFKFDTLRIAEDLYGLLMINAPKDEAEKDIYMRSGRLSKYGEKCVSALVGRVKLRVALDEDGTPEENIPNECEETILSIQQITGIQWDKEKMSMIMGPLMNQIKNGGASKYSAIDEFCNGFDDED